MKAKLAGCVYLCLFTATTAFAGDELFEAGHHEVGFAAGGLFSPILPDHGRATINYTFTSLQLGWMLHDVRQRDWLSGNFELAVEGFGGAIYEGPGSYVAGGTVWLRYN